MEFLEGLKDLITFITSNSDKPLSYSHVIFSALVILIGFLISMFITYKKDRKLDIYGTLLEIGLGLVAAILIIWLVGPPSTLFAIIFAFIFAIFVRNKYFDFIHSGDVYKVDTKNQNELQRLKREFKDNPHYSILEVLLHYGYISPLQKEYVETENIFESPDEMAKRFLTMTVLTEEQLKEAKAIMNIIRMEHKILTKQDALLLISQMKERSDKDEESGDQ